MKRLAAIGLAFVLLLTVLLVPPFAQAQGPQTWRGVCVAGPDGDVATIQGFQCLIGNILSVAVTGIGLAGFVMLIVGAFTYQLSGGSSKSAETARNTITFAIVGLVVALSSFIILNMIAAFTGINAVTQFTIFAPNTVFNTP